MTIIKTRKFEPRGVYLRFLFWSFFSIGRWWLFQFFLKKKNLNSTSSVHQFGGHHLTSFFLLHTNSEGWSPAAYLESINRKSSRSSSRNQERAVNVNVININSN